MTQVFVSNSAYGLMTAIAAIDAGAVPGADRRVLVSVNAAVVPETASGPGEAPLLRGILSRFDEVFSLNDLLAPNPPTTWSPQDEDGPMLERLLRRAWRLSDGPVELFLQSPQVPPGRTLAALFPGAPITIVGDGLMSYSPIRLRLPRAVVERVGAVVYADVVPGVHPLLFTEVGARPVPIPVERMRAVADEVSIAVEDPDVERLAQGAVPTALVLGQYLAALGLITEAEEGRMQADMVDRAMQWGPRRIVFKPHPSAPPSMSAAVRDRCAERGVVLETYEGDVPAEILATRLDAVGVVAGFSSALTSARAMLGLPIASAGNELLLGRLEPYENGNRIPVTIVDALTRPSSPYASPAALQALVDAVGYCMQPTIMAHLRQRAVRVLSTMGAAERERYFSVQRLTELRLPGGRRASVISRVLTPTGELSRAEEARLVLRGAKRRVIRAWKALQGQ